MQPATYQDRLNDWFEAKDEIKERYLLYGEILTSSLEWSKGQHLTEKNNSYLTQSQLFQQKIESSFPKGNYQSFGDAILAWTGGVKFLNNFIFERIDKRFTSISKKGVDVKQWLDTEFDLVGKLKEDESIQKKVEEIMNDFFNSSECDSISLLLKYQEILEKEEVNFDENSLEHKTLINMCLLILDKNNKLRIINKIYEKLLNKDWIKEVMEKLRPYKKAFRNWKSLASDSHRQKRAYLLKNNDLKLALEWLGKKPTPKLEVSEIEFVMTSLVSEFWATASPSVQSEAISLIITFRPSLQEKNNYSDFLLQEILEWTRPEPILLNELLEEVNKTEIFTTNYHNWIEQLVKTQIINKWQNSKLAKHFRLIEQGLTKNQSCESFWLIAKYRQILLQGKIEFDETKKNTKLIELGLAVKIDQQIEIANPIYENIFSQRWTYQKLSEYKQILAINLLKWCLTSDPQKKDPAQHSYLDEWINNNLPVVQKIVQDAQGEILDNEFNFIDEIKLLTYDIMNMKTLDTTQINIQYSLNRIFKDDVKKMAQNNLDSLLNEIVETAEDVQAIVILGLKKGLVVGKNSNLGLSNPSLYQIVRSETFVSFVKLKIIPDILDNFGEKTDFGKLSYAMFTLKKGVVLSRFTRIKGSPFAICFISNSGVDMLGMFLFKCEGNFEKIQKELEKIVESTPDV